MNGTSKRYSGSCTCGHIQYSLLNKPLIVHCCHCTWCQRETGTAFATNALIEASEVDVSHGECELIDTPSSSGNGQIIARCPKCKVAVWSHYHKGGPNINFIRVGTLNEPHVFPPDVHIHSSSKQPWVLIPAAVPEFTEFYDPGAVWSQDSLQRFFKARDGN